MEHNQQYLESQNEKVFNKTNRLIAHMDSGNLKLIGRNFTATEYKSSLDKIPTVSLNGLCRVQYITD